MPTENLMKKTSLTATLKAARPTAKRAITPEDLLGLHAVSDPQISPNGTSILFVEKHVGEKNEYETNLWLVATNGARANSSGEPRQFTSGKRDSHGRWSPDGQQIAFLSGAIRTIPKFFSCPRPGAKPRRSPGFRKGPSEASNGRRTDACSPSPIAKRRLIARRRRRRSAKKRGQHAAPRDRRLLLPLGRRRVFRRAAISALHC